MPATVRFGAAKRLGRPRGEWRGHEVVAYEIHHGVVEPYGGERFLDGVRSGNTWGTIWHGAFENDGFRRAWLAEVAGSVGSDCQPDAGAPGLAALRTRMLDHLADALEAHADLDALLRLARSSGVSG